MKFYESKWKSIVVFVCIAVLLFSINMCMSERTQCYDSMERANWAGACETLVFLEVISAIIYSGYEEEKEDSTVLEPLRNIFGLNCLKQTKRSEECEKRSKYLPTFDPRM